MAMRNFYDVIRGLKVTELPNHLKPLLRIDTLKNAIKRGLDNYHAKYIQTSSVQPLYHVCFGGMVLSYFVHLPEMRRRREHEQHHVKEQGGGGGGGGH